MSDFEKRRRKLKPREGGGISSPIGGFTRPKKGRSEQDKVRDLATRLEEKRVLPAHLESEWIGLTVESIVDVRKMLTDALLDLGPKAAASSHRRSQGDLQSLLNRRWTHRGGREDARP